MALDRIIAIDYEFNQTYLEEDFDVEEFYKYVVGVTVNKGLQPRVIQLWLDRTNAPYAITKPLHSTQRILQQNEDGSIIISLYLKENFEFERLLLGFGAGLEVLKPERLRNRIKTILEHSLHLYQSEATQ